MRSVSEIVTPSSDWAFATSIGLNTNILEINLINLILVLGILFYYGKGVCASRLAEWESCFIQLHSKVQKPDEFLVSKEYTRTEAFRGINEAFNSVHRFPGLSSIWLKLNCLKS